MTKTRNLKFMQSLRFLTLILIFTSVLPLSIWAQSKTITGKVTDSNNEPIIGATVMVKNSNIGTITNKEGKYSINAPENATS